MSASAVRATDDGKRKGNMSTKKEAQIAFGDTFLCLPRCASSA